MSINSQKYTLSLSFLGLILYTHETLTLRIQFPFYLGLTYPGMEGSIWALIDPHWHPKGFGESPGFYYSFGMAEGFCISFTHSTRKWIFNTLAIASTSCTCPWRVSLLHRHLSSSVSNLLSSLPLLQIPGNTHGGHISSSICRDMCTCKWQESGLQLDQKWTTEGASLLTEPSGSWFNSVWLSSFRSFPHQAGGKVAAADVLVTSLYDNLHCHAREYLPLALSRRRELESVASGKGHVCPISACVPFPILTPTLLSQGRATAQDDQGPRSWGWKQELKNHSPWAKPCSLPTCGKQLCK